MRSNLLKLARWSPSELGLDCVLGIKFYCMLLITAGHGVVFLATGPISNADYVREVGGRERPLPAPETFRLLSGKQRAARQHKPDVKIGVGTLCVRTALVRGRREGFRLVLSINAIIPADVDGR